MKTKPLSKDEKRGMHRAWILAMSSERNWKPGEKSIHRAAGNEVFGKKRKK